MYGLTDCANNYEYKDATSIITSHTVTDYMDYARTVSINFDADYYSTDSASSDRMRCTRTNYGNTFEWSGILDYNHMAERYLTLMGVSYSNIVDDDGFKEWQQYAYNHFTLTHSKTFTFKTNIQECDTANGYQYYSTQGNCKKDIDYSFIQYSCDANDKNPQGYGWELTAAADVTDSQIGDSNLHANNSATLDDTLYSHSTTPRCKRKYQECSINCTSPLTLDTATGKCKMTYEKDCETKGMVYDSTAKVCRKENQCGNPQAVKDFTSDYCTNYANCTVMNGVCSENAIKYCDNTGMTFNYLTNRCEQNTNCLSSQFPLNNGYCGSRTVCADGDTETLTDCINTVDRRDISCSPDVRNNNVCYKTSSLAEDIPISYNRDLVKTQLSGVFKEEEFGSLKEIYCTNDDGNCTFRLTDIFTQNNGSEICFQDNVGGFGCVKIDGACRLDGSIHSDYGIRQLFIENNNKSIVGYNKAISESNVGVIHSNCLMSGKVGALDTNSKKRDIIAAKANGSEILFWDSYKRGMIGVITFLPTIPDSDMAEGFVYEEPDIMKLYTSGFTGFYAFNNATYAVYNGLIPKVTCDSLRNGTSFYLSQAETDEEASVLNMLSFLGGNNFNYNDGNEENGSCVLKSLTAKSFNEQNYSVKHVNVENVNTRYVCSPLQCTAGYCQYNTCPTNFVGNIIEQNDFTNFLTTKYPTAQQSDICIDDYCDSNKPYYPYCGSNYGCLNDGKTFQQTDGSCVQFNCAPDETADYETGKCVKLDCKNSTKRNGKCYKTLEL